MSIARLARVPRAFQVFRVLRVGLALSFLGGSLPGSPGLAEPGEPTRAAGEAPSKAPVEDAAPVPPVGLDALLKLPAGAPAPEGQRTGDGPEEWRARFATARGELASAEAALADAQQQLEQLASGGGSWQVAAPGAQAGSDTGPLSFGLRQEIRRQREAVERAQRQLDELRIEANLEGVPEEWTREPPAGP
jgi:hypothetical protein